MNAPTNFCTFSGRITKDPIESLQNFAGGGVKLILNIAVKTRAFDKTGESYERTDYPQLILWGDLATQTALEMQKGMAVEVEAQLQTRRWKANDGTNRYATEFVVTSIRRKAGSSAA